MDKTTQGLKLLAEYMGLKVGDMSIETYQEFRINYNTSWDALVPVYAKVCSEILSDEAVDYFVGLFELNVCYNNPQAAFEAVVELVTLINKEK